MAVARYGAIGTDWLQFHVVFPFAVDVETRRPLASAVSPSGTVTEMSKSALSFGLSLAGYQPGDPCGSLTTYAPSSVGTKPSIESSGSVIGTTTPEYSTTTENCVPSRGFSRGKTVSSWPECDHSAASILKPCFVPGPDARDSEEVAEVEIEALEAVRRLGDDRRRPDEPIGRRVVVELQRVLLDVVAAVPGEREERVAEPR